MNGNTDSTSNSIKLAPMSMSALRASLMQLQNQPESSDGSYTSVEDSDESFGHAVANNVSTPLKLDKDNSTPSRQMSGAKDIKDFLSERKKVYDEYNKENSVGGSCSGRVNSSQIWKSNITYPDNTNSKDVRSLTNFVSSKKTPIRYPEIKNSKDVRPLVNSVSGKKTPVRYPDIKNNKDIRSIPNLLSDKKTPVSKSLGSDMKRSFLIPPTSITRNQINVPGSGHKRTPEMRPPSANKLKSATPKIKSGIRKFTPGSGKHSNKKPVNNIIQNRDKVRIELFSKKLKEEPQKRPEPTPLASVPIPETPSNRQPMPASYIATPSYPQGVVGGNSKILFKTTSIKDKKYMFVKKLGVGGSSEVYKVLEVATSCEYAVKCVQLGSDKELAQGYINEVRLLRELQNSDRVVRLIDYEYDRVNQFLRLVLEVGETDLSSFLKARGGILTPALVLHYWAEMLLAVHYIHEHGVIHADLKPANFLLVSGQLKLIDFGIASAVSSDATSVVRAQAAGTYSYISPEALMGGAGGCGQQHTGQPIKISFRSDVWSLGCILYSMVYGRTPFGHIPNLAKLAAILDPNHRIDYPPANQFPQPLLSALRACLTYNARARPTVRELLAIQYLQLAPQPPPARPLPAHTMEKLRATLTPEEYADLVSRL